MFFKDNPEPMLLKMGGPVVGFIDGVDYKHEIIAFDPGDLCVLFSDGVTEAMDAFNNEFGEKQLLDLIIEYRNLTSNEIIDKIFEAVSEHSKHVTQSDDITAVVIKRKEL